MGESSLMHKIHDSSSASSSSSSEDEKRPALARQAATVKAKAKEKAIHYKAEVNRLFGREQPVHKVLGAGKAADIFLWRNKRSSGMVLGAGTMLWFFFERMEYHLITFICHFLIVSLAALFLWSNASVFIHNRAPVQVPQVAIPEDCLIHIVKALRFEINRAFLLLREIGTGRDIKKFLTVVGILWLISLVGSCFNFLTLFYLCFLLLFTLPLVYEKNEDQIDALAEKAMIEIKKQYAVLDAKVLSQIPVAGFKKD
ncbi:reticulon-like protein B1 isoform X1 [Arachis ipaensis]|uniref:reticulon-like protein B1 isoform X1 n=1 Tax=Arachis ipaensis TaxID=130454 RepID=UPI000A2B8C97|nr:reticulon-like protein B1 isoform X1 [Arachis ipaensis]